MSLRQVTISALRDEADEPFVTFRDVTASDDDAAVATTLQLVGGGEKDWLVVCVNEIRNVGQLACDRVVQAAKKAQPSRDLFGVVI